MHYRVSQIRGNKVEDLDGQKLGTVKDLILDLASGEVKYAVVGTGGVAGVGSKAKIVPARALSAATTKKQTMALNVPKARWKNAPSFKRKDLATLAEPGRALQIKRFYARSADGFKNGERAQVISKPAPLSPTSRQGKGVAEALAPLSILYLAADIIGKQVINGQEQNVGEISDLAVDLTGHKPTMAVITEKKLLKRDPTFTVPLHGAKLIPGGKLVIALAVNSE